MEGTRMDDSNRKKYYVILAIILMIGTMLITKWGLDVEAKEEKLEQDVLELQYVSKLMDDFMDKIDEEKYGQSFVVLGKIKAASTSTLYHLVGDYRNVTEDKQKIGCLLSEIYFYADIYSYDITKTERLSKVYAEFDRMNEVLREIRKPYTSTKDRYQHLVEGIENDLDLRYSVPRSSEFEQYYLW